MVGNHDISNAIAIDASEIEILSFEVPRTAAMHKFIICVKTFKVFIH